MNAIELIKEEDEMFRQLFGEYGDAQESDDGPARNKLAIRLMNELTAHEQMEEDVFFPELRKPVSDEGEDDLDEGLQEHHVADLLINELRDLDPDDDEFKPKMKVLQENVEHHLEEEEENILPRANRVFSSDELEDLGSRMAEVKASALEDAGVS